MVHIIKCLRKHHHNDFIKNFQDYGGFQGVSFFFQKTMDKARYSDVVSVSQLQKHNGLTVSWKLWRNLCPLR